MPTMRTEADRLPPPPRLKLPGVFLRRADFSGADMTGADLRGADARHAMLVGVDLQGASLDRTDLRGADLTGARNLTLEQLRSAILDADTKLPAYIDPALLIPVAAG